MKTKTEDKKSTWAELRELIVKLQASMLPNEIEAWNDICVSDNKDKALQFVGMLRARLDLLDACMHQMNLMHVQLKLSERAITRHNSIVGWIETGLTVSIDSEDEGEHLNTRDAAISNDILPAQYTRKDAITIADTIKNGSGEAPKVWKVKEWYTSRIERLTKTYEVIMDQRKNLN